MSDLPTLLTLPEGKTLEFKRDLSSPEKVLRTLVAFANGAGGTLVVGVEDKTRHVVGLKDATGVEEQLANLVSDRIAPKLVPDLRLVAWRRTHVLVAEVFPSSSRPHYLKAQGLPDGVYVRVGSTNRQADPAQVDELRRVVLGRTFDEEPLPELNSEAIDFRAASECFARVRPLQRAELRSLGILTRHQGREVPTVGGVLLFGAKRQEVFPDAYIRAGCFRGRDRSEILDSVEIRSLPVAALEEALQFVKRNTRRAIAVRSLQHSEIWEYPLVAIREAVINALVHADYAQRGMPLRLAVYEDRIEVENPGGLPPGLTLEDIRRGFSKLRNRVIGRVFHELKLIEQWGSGVRRMTTACVEAGLAEPQFEEIGTGFRVTFRRERVEAPQLDEANAAIVEFVRRKPGVSTAEIADKIGLSTRATRGRLNRLVAMGLVVPVGSGPQDPRRRFHPAAKH